MTEAKVRAFPILSSAEYLRQSGGQQAIDALSPALKHTLQTAEPASWQPVELANELFHAVAKLGNGNEEAARKHLELCGEYQGKASTNAFLKLVMKVLTPKMLAKKAPSLYARDCTVGSLEVDVADDHLTCRFKDIEILDHFVPTSIGFNRFILHTMGLKITKTVLFGWSLEKPSSSDIGYTNYWEV